MQLKSKRIAELGQEEAIKRVEAYVEAGADAILILGREQRPDETLSLCRDWEANVPRWCL